MTIYDISQELITSRVFPGDPAPRVEQLMFIDKGDVCNISRIIMGSHSGSHMDAPFHFLENGKTIDEISLEKCIGDCKVIELCGKLDAKQVEEALSDGTKRLLIKGDIEITIEAAKKMTDMDLWFLGVEGLTVGPMASPKEVHLELLGKDVVIVEGLVLAKVPTDTYMLVSQPLKLGGLDGSPCRPLLLKNDE